MENLADVMKDYADAATELAASVLETDLDYSDASTDDLEDILETYHDQYVSGIPSKEELNQMTIAWAAYFGETIRKNFGGEWRMVDDQIAIVLKDEPIFVVSKVRSRICEAPDDNIARFYLGLKTKIASEPKT